MEPTTSTKAKSTVATTTGNATATARPRLKLRDVRRVFRLLAEVRRRGDDPLAWRPFMAKALLGLFRADLVISSELYLLPTDQPDTWEIYDVGWGADGTGHDWRIENRSRETNPRIYDVTIRADTAPADDGRVAIAPARPMYGGSAFMLSHIALPHINAVDQLGVHRGHDAEPFTPADHRLLRLLHVELGRFWRADALRKTTDPCQTLAPRLKQTLTMLAEGKSEKEIAHATALSPHTVHNYVKALHQRLGVSSRGELVAAAKREKEFVPRLTVEVQPVAKRKPAKSRNRVTRRRPSPGADVSRS